MTDFTCVCGHLESKHSGPALACERCECTGFREQIARQDGNPEDPSNPVYRCRACGQHFRQDEKIVPNGIIALLDLRRYGRHECGDGSVELVGPHMRCPMIGNGGMGVADLIGLVPRETR